MNIKKTNQIKASPQIRIPRDLYTELLFRDFTGTQSFLLMHIARYHFGFNKLKCCLCNRTELCYTGLDKSAVSKGIKFLVDSCVLLEGEESFEINTQIDKWLIPIKSTADRSRFESIETYHILKQAELINNQQKNDL